VTTSEDGTAVSSYCWDFYQSEPDTFSCDESSGDSLHASGTYSEATPGNWFGRVVIAGANGCTVAATSAEVEVFAPLALIQPEVDGTCDDTFLYSAHSSGGDGSYSFDWSYSIDGISDTNFSEHIDHSIGSRDVAEAPHRVPRFVAASVQLSDGRCGTFDPGCCQSGTDTTIIYSPLVVAMSGPDESCSDAGGISDSVDLTPDVTGGDGTYIYSLNGVSCEPGHCVADLSSDCLLTTYTITVDDENLCNNSGSITVEKTTTLTFT